MYGVIQTAVQSSGWLTPPWCCRHSSVNAANRSLTSGWLREMATKWVLSSFLRPLSAIISTCTLPRWTLASCLAVISAQVEQYIMLKCIHLTRHSLTPSTQQEVYTPIAVLLYILNTSCNGVKKALLKWSVKRIKLHLHYTMAHGWSSCVQATHRAWGVLEVWGSKGQLGGIGASGVFASHATKQSLVWAACSTNEHWTMLCFTGCGSPSTRHCVDVQDAHTTSSCFLPLDHTDEWVHNLCRHAYWLCIPITYTVYSLEFCGFKCLKVLWIGNHPWRFCVVNFGDQRICFIKWTATA